MSSSLMRQALGIFVLVSTLTCAISFGRQQAWSTALANWNCEPANLPQVPGIIDSLLSAGAFDWIYGLVIPLVLAKLFLVAGKTPRSLLFWGPVLTFHLYLRFLMMEDSKRTWGWCGLKDGLEINVVGEFVFLLFVMVFAVPLLASSLLTARRK